MKHNYDSWSTKVPKNINAGTKAHQVLKVMADGLERLRSDMLRDADLDPNPRGPSGCAGNETSDYFLYKLGYLDIVGYKGHQKIFKITQKGLERLNELEGE
jgi:hypothetical protein